MTMVTNGLPNLVSLCGRWFGDVLPNERLRTVLTANREGPFARPLGSMGRKGTSGGAGKRELEHEGPGLSHLGRWTVTAESALTQWDLGGARLFGGQQSGARESPAAMVMALVIY